MATKNKKAEIPELQGKRIYYNKLTNGAGIIESAWIHYTGGVYIAVVYDENSEYKEYDLSVCCKHNLITFEDPELTNDAILNIIHSYQNPEEAKHGFKETGKPNVQSAAPQPVEVESPQNISLEDDNLDLLLGFSPEPVLVETLTPAQQEEEKQAIYQYLTKERGVKQLVHFTPEKNLPSILKHGILPRTEIAGHNIEAVTPDLDRFDFQLNYSSFSVSFPNYLIFYSKRINMPEIPFVVLCIDPRIILDLPLRSISYLPDNAASNSIQNVLHYTGLEAAKGLFCNSTTVKGTTHQRYELELPDNFPTNPQAEVFIQGIIPVEYINAIHTENSQQNESVRTVLPKQLAKKINVFTRSNLYSARKDHTCWLKTENKNH